MPRQSITAARPKRRWRLRCGASFGRRPRGPKSVTHVSEEAGFIGGFVARFLSATMLPAGSDVVRIAWIHAGAEVIRRPVGAATVGSTLGGMTSYWPGRMSPNRAPSQAIVHRHEYGSWARLASRRPRFGDVRCAAAAWLRVNPWRSPVLFALGKWFRHVQIAGGRAGIELALLTWVDFACRSRRAAFV